MFEYIFTAQFSYETVKGLISVATVSINWCFFNKWDVFIECKTRYKSNINDVKVKDKNQDHLKQYVYLL